jgi:23S rRNA (cytidine1920-2'-O)/16S rRNA (cytidine1409-2'-O)-methyltransferase
VRQLEPGDLPGEAPSVVVADLSFISLATVLPVLRRLAAPEAEGVVLVKPQFEAGREAVGKGGVVRDPAVWTRALVDVADAAARVGWRAVDATASPLLGPAGNVEFLLHLVPGDSSEKDLGARIEAAVTEGVAHRERHTAAGGRPTDERGGHA